MTNPPSTLQPGMGGSLTGHFRRPQLSFAQPTCIAPRGIPTRIPLVTPAKALFHEHEQPHHVQEIQWQPGVYTGKAYCGMRTKNRFGSNGAQQQPRCDQRTLSAIGSWRRGYAISRGGQLEINSLSISTDFLGEVSALTYTSGGW